MNPPSTALLHRLLRFANDGSVGFISVVGVVEREGEELADLVQELADRGWAEVQFTEGGGRRRPRPRIQPRIKLTDLGQAVLETLQERRREDGSS